MGKFRSTFAEYGLGPQQVLTYQMNLLVLFQKSMILLITLPMPLVNLITIPQCNWPSTLRTIANNGVRCPHIVEGIYGNNEQRWLGNLIQSIETDRDE